MRALRNALRWFENTLMGILLITMVTVIFAQVISRFVFNSPLSWSEELARYLFIWIIFIGASVAVREKAHFGIDFFVELFPNNLQKIMEYVSYLSMIIFAGVMIIYGIEMVKWTHMQISPSLHIHMSLPNLAIPVSGMLICINVIFNMFTKKGYKEES